MERRDFLTDSSGAGALVLFAASGLPLVQAHAQNVPGWNKAAFEAKSLADVARTLGAASPPAESRDVLLQAPEIADNGSVVRVSAQSTINNTTQICFVVDKNPSALAAVFDIPAGTESSVSTNLKMAQSSNVYALVKADGKYFFAVREVKVTLGGCGA
ncbi:MAG: thiosulfate oxidation carrier protein SoxY [Pseudomonadota bacterium]